MAYEPEYFTLFYNVSERFSIYAKSDLFDEMLRIPRGKIKLLGFIMKNFRKYHTAYTPTNTRFSALRGRLCAKKYEYSMNSLNDQSGPYIDIVERTLNRKVNLLSEYKHYLKLDYSDSYKDLLGLRDTKFVTLFVSLIVRCLPIDELKKVLQYVNDQGFAVVLVGGDREKWIHEYMDISEYNIIDALGRTDFVQISSLLTDAAFNISMDGGLMRLGHLMNKRNISVQNVSFFAMDPPVDNVHSFNLRRYAYPCCKPCNHFEGPKNKHEKHWITRCVFYGTERE